MRVAQSQSRSQSDPAATPWPRDLLACPCGAPAAAWHRAQLGRGSSAARAAYHAAWLAHLETPAEPALLPRVAIVIPAFEAGATLEAAVRSGLEQTYPRIEIVVVDDGSTQPVAPILAHCGPRVRVIRQPNTGVSGARNTGVRGTHAELVHFLDADDMLDPACIERKVDALRAVPDAEVCVASYRSIGDNGVKSGDDHTPPIFGDTFCPTRDLLACCVRRYPFHTSTVLAARCLLLEAGPMDERMAQGEDSRHWFQVARRGAKVVAIDRALGTRRFVPNSLTSRKTEHERFSALASMMNLRDILGDASQWNHLVPALRRVHNETRWQYVTRDDDPLVEKLREELLDAIAELPETGNRAGLSAHPPCAMFRQLVSDAARIAGPHTGSADRFGERLSSAADRARVRSAPLTARDLEFWVGARLEPAELRRWLFRAKPGVRSAGLMTLYFLRSPIGFARRHVRLWLRLRTRSRARPVRQAGGGPAAC